MKDACDSFACSQFNPHLYGPIYKSAGCGATALSLITGVNPFNIQNTNKNPEHWSDSFLINFLQVLGYKTLKIEKKILFNEEISSPISNDHVILLSQQFTKKEASWAVIYNKYYIHNFQIYPLSPLEFINHPILTAYLVAHPDWK